jgi:hypothetical protein
MQMAAVNARKAMGDLAPPHGQRYYSTMQAWAERMYLCPFQGARSYFACKHWVMLSMHGLLLPGMHAPAMWARLHDYISHQLHQYVA